MDEAVLLDTDVFSFIARGDVRAGPFRPHLEGRRLCLSFATVAEVYKGFYRARWTEDRMAKVEQHLKNFVVVPYDFELSRVCGRIPRELPPVRWRPDANSATWSEVLDFRVPSESAFGVSRPSATDVDR